MIEVHEIIEIIDVPAVVIILTCIVAASVAIARALGKHKARRQAERAIEGGDE